MFGRFSNLMCRPCRLNVGSFRWILALALLGSPAPMAAQPTEPPAPAEGPEGPSSTAAQRLAEQQRQIAEQFSRLEDLFLRLAELAEKTDPRRAELLRRAVAQSKDRLLAVQFDRLAQMLAGDQIAQATTQQQALTEELRGLLELLLNENRSEQLRSEKAMLAELARDVAQLLTEQQGLHSRTERAVDVTPLAPSQSALADRAADLARSMRTSGVQKNAAEQETPRGDSRDKSPTGDIPAEEQPSHAPSVRLPEESDSDEPSADVSAPSQDTSSQDTPNGAPADQAAGPSGQESAADDAEPPMSTDEELAHSQESSQARAAAERVESARQRMRSAEQRLAAAEQEAATTEQEAALRELQAAKAELERVLRQMREEEIAQALAQLEARFRQMLQRQQAIRQETVRLDQVPSAAREREHRLEAGRLSRRESQLVADADRVRLLLEQDGTAVALPETLTQVRGDMQQIADRLAEGDPGQPTQDLEQDVIELLEELIAAVQSSQQTSPPPTGEMMPSGESQEQTLVNRLAELRMIRSLQMRVNRRTAAYQALLQAEQAEDPQLLEALEALAERQARIYEVTHDLVEEQR